MADNRVSASGRPARSAPTPYYAPHIVQLLTMLPAESKPTETEPEAQPTETTNDEEKKDTEPAASGDAETKDAAAAEPAAPKADRRKSGAGEAKGKALNRKGSKAKLNFKDAKPGDHFLVKLKGFPPWPAIVCTDDMIPDVLRNNRPVSAARADGTYTDAYADGGKRSQDRTFPVMYLFTNEL